MLTKYDVKDSDQKMHQTLIEVSKRMRQIFWVHDKQSLVGKNLSLVNTLVGAFESVKGAAHTSKTQMKHLSTSINNQIHSLFVKAKNEVNGLISHLYLNEIL